MAKFGDPDFLYHKALTQVIGLLTLRIADQSMFLPCAVSAYDHLSSHAF